MKKSMNKYFTGLAIATFILGLSSSIFGQPQVYQGCADSSYDYSNRKVFYKKPIGTPRELMRIDQAEGSESRFVFTFRPNTGGITRGGILVFTPYMYGRDMKSYDPSYPSPIDNLRLERKSQLAEEDFALLNWDETILESVTQTGDWYVIYQRAEDFVLPNNVERYIFPLTPSELQAANGMVDARLVPLTRYFFNGNLVASLPEGASSGGTVKSMVRKLSPSMEFDTRGLDYGKYWVTLQNTANFTGQNPSQCAKTTPPVLIEIMEKIPDKNYRPTVSIKIDGEDCDQKTITVSAGDKNNEPGDPLNPQTIKLSWKITNKSNGAVVKSDKVTFTDAAYRTDISTGNIPLGNYTVEAYVTDNFLDDSASGVFANEDLNIKCKGAGLIYFQFDEPYNGRVIYNPANYTNPESWVAFNRRVKVKNQCTDRQGLYPEGEFADFYEKFKIATPSTVESNTDKLERILKVLMENPSYKILIYGYADFRRRDSYNIPLVDRRMQVVMNYLQRRSEELGNPLDVGRYTRRQNVSDHVARCNGNYFNDSCFIERRQDRRVELIYYADSYQIEDLNLPKYEKSECDPNAMLINMDEIEWEMSE